jgi:hypothetical protein
MGLGSRGQKDTGSRIQIRNTTRTVFRIFARRKSNDQYYLSVTQIYIILIKQNHGPDLKNGIYLCCR